MMKLGTKAAVVASGLVLVVSPAALASGSPSDPDQPGPGASPPAKAKAYGRYCQDQRKKHVAGQKGTPFSQCVTAMAKVASGRSEERRVGKEGRAGWETEEEKE